MSKIFDFKRLLCLNNLNMKEIFSMFFSLFFLSGCSSKSEIVEVILWHPEVFIEYVNKDGSKIISSTDAQPSFIKNYPVENILITNKEGKIFEYRIIDYPCIHIDIWDTFNSTETKKQKSEHNYIIKYKIPNLIGESFEEIKLTYMVDKLFAEFTQVRYNENENFRFVTEEMICPDCRESSYKPDDEKMAQRVKELLYNGDRVAYKERGRDIYIIIPIN